MDFVVFSTLSLGGWVHSLSLSQYGGSNYFICCVTEPSVCSYGKFQKHLLPKWQLATVKQHWKKGHNNLACKVSNQNNPTLLHLRKDKGKTTKYETGKNIRRKSAIWHIKDVEKFFFQKMHAGIQGSQEIVCDVDCVSQCKMQPKQTHCVNKKHPLALTTFPRFA